MNSNHTTHFRFISHNRRIILLTIIASLVLLVFGALALLLTFGLLPSSLNWLTVIAYIIAVIAFSVLMPVLFFLYSYARSGVEIDTEGVRIQFPGEDPQQMTWSEAIFAIDEGEEYLRLSKGKEGLGHLVGSTRYIRLHLEGMTPEQREQALSKLAEHVEVRHPQLFTLMTLLNTKGDIVARGRLYLLDDNEVLCTENRGEKRVFFHAPLKELERIEPRSPFYIGQMECDAFIIKYHGKDYVIMLGYEITLVSSLGNTSSWSRTGSAQEWLEALTTV